MLFFLKKKYKKAVSLIETSVVLGILGASIATAIPAISYLKNITPKMTDETKMQNIKSALKEYFKIHNRLPKPASIKLARSSSNYGLEKTTTDDNDLSFDSDFHTATTEKNFSTDTANKNTAVPSDYQQVEYIESTGTQYIDTGFKPNSNTKLEFKINFQGGGHFLAYDKNNRYGFYYDGVNFRYDRQTLMTNVGTFNTGVDWYIEEYKGVKIGTSPNSLTTYATDTTSFSVNQNFCLFAMCYNTDNTPNWFSKAKLYYFKMYNNGTLIRDFVACYRKSDGVAGMYDTVGKKFYTNANSSSTANFVIGQAQTSINVKYIIHRGIVPFKELGLSEKDVVDNNGNFFEYYVPEIMTLKKGTAPTTYQNNATTTAFYKVGYGKKGGKNGEYYEYPCISQKNSKPEYLCEKGEYDQHGVEFIESNNPNIPNTYEQVEYIQGTGSQKINLNYTLTTSTRIQFKYVYQAYSGGIFIGKIYENGSDNNDYRFFRANDVTYFDAGDNSTRIGTTYITSTTSIYETEIYNYGIKDLSGNYVVATSNGTVNVSSAQPFGIFMTSGDYGKIYYIKIYEGTTLKRHYLPCIRKSDKVIGLYDTIEKKFYTNSGTGTFLYGLKNTIETRYIQPPYGLRIRDIEVEQQTAKYDNNKGVYVVDPTQAYVDNNGEIAYVLISHGENSNKTCGIQSPKTNNTAPVFISSLTSCAKIGQNDKDTITANTLDDCVKTTTSKYEAQNCFNVEENDAFDLIGREKFLSGKNHEITFYQGKKSQSFDDIVEYETLAGLLYGGTAVANY